MSLSCIGAHFLVLTLVAACAAPEDSATSEAAYTRNGGVIGQAPTIQLGETKRGTITEGQIDV